MDTGEGRFKYLEGRDIEEIEKDLEKLKEEYPKHGGVFKVGEEIQIRNSIFRIKSIKPKELRLRLMRKI